MRRIAAFLAVLGLLFVAAAGPVAAQELHVEIADAIAEQGWWDDSGSLDASRMQELVAASNGAIGFAYTERSFDVAGDDNLQAAALLAQSALDELSARSPSVETVLLVTGDERSGASEVYGFSQVVLSLDGWVDGGDPVDSFAAVLERLEDPSLAPAAAPETGADDTVTSSAEQEVFSLGRLILLGAIVIGAFILWNTYKLRRNTRRTVTTSSARDDTAAQLTAMSDLILELEPRVTIANDADLKERFTLASRTYSDVREAAQDATTGHEIADLRLEIAEARWKLDVIEAELDGRPAPPQPHRRDNSGSAWDSTRGTGGGG
jgi:hypothetical protein